MKKIIDSIIELDDMVNCLTKELESSGNQVDRDYLLYQKYMTIVKMRNAVERLWHVVESKYDAVCDEVTPEADRMIMDEFHNRSNG